MQFESDYVATESLYAVIAATRPTLRSFIAVAISRRFELRPVDASNIVLTASIKASAAVRTAGEATNRNSSRLRAAACTPAWLGRVWPTCSARIDASV
jgi:hypothetical protein